jgi:predicted permease
MIFKQWWLDIRARLASLFRRKEIYRRADEELEFHLAMLEQRIIASGVSPDEARILARRQLGNTTRIKEQTLEAWRYTLVDTLIRDFRYALRTLRKNLSFSATAVLTLALGIGATTAIFSVVYSVLIKPLPYVNADELVRIRHGAPGMDNAELFASTNMHITYSKESRTFASIGLWMEDSATLTDHGEAERVRALRVADGTLQALGIQPMRGRGFTEQEHSPTASGPAPVILSHAFWQRRFGGDEAVLGRELAIDSPGGAGTLSLEASSQVVGILPPGFQFLDSAPQPDIIVPVRFNPERQAHGLYAWQMLARLKPGVTLAEAQADLERIQPIWLDAWPPFPGTTKQQLVNMRITPVLHPLLDDMVGGVASMLWVLMGAIGAVLLIACANIANLMLVRASARRPEFAVRAALGARPARIARELLIESLVLGAAGSAVGLALAYAGLRALVAIGPGDLPRLQEIAVYPPVLAFTVAISLASTFVFGSITAFKHALHIDAPMTGAARGSSASHERSATRNTLVVVQVALALVLVVSAALMIRTFQALRDIDPGFSDSATIQTARIWIPPGLSRDAAQITRIEREILDKIAAIPGVAGAGFASQIPMEGLQNNGPVTVEGQTVAPGTLPPQRRWIRVSPGYFAAVGTRMIVGRDVTWNDIETGGRVAVISENFARELATEPAGALGGRIRVGPFAQDDWKEVIGVVQSVQQDGLYGAAPRAVYWPTLASNTLGSPIAGTSSVAFAIRTERAGTASLVEEIRQAVRSVSGSIPIAQERTVHDLYAGSLARTSFTLVLLGIAGAMALVLGVIGIYGAIAYVVSQRTREIGIRLALGERPERLQRRFLLHGLALSAVGAVVGLVGAMALGRSMSSLLFGIRSLDPMAYIAALGLTLSAAALASYLPACRASTIDPLETLKGE